MKYYHPLANAQQARLDILYGGTEDEVMLEVCRIANDTVRTLELEENIFILNSLVSKARFEPLMMKIMARKKRECIRGATYYGRLLMDRLEFLRFLVPTVKTRMVILTGFDVAVFNSRDRMKLLELIKWMRDDLNLRIIICMQSQPTGNGAHGTLRMMASSIERIGNHMIAVKDKNVGAMPAEMNNALWPYKHTETRTVFDHEPSPEAIAYAESEGLGPWEDPEEAMPGDTMQQDMIEEQQPSQETGGDAERSIDRELKKLVNGFTEEETSFGEYAVREHHWKHDHSPFSKGAYGNGASMNNGACSVEK